MCYMISLAYSITLLQVWRIYFYLLVRILGWINFTIKLRFHTVIVIMPFWKLFKRNQVLSVIFVVLKHNINAGISWVVDHRFVSLIWISWILIGRHNNTPISSCIFTDQNFSVVHVTVTLTVWWWVGRIAGIGCITCEVDTSAINRG
jgi:hypothetical protein